MNNSTVLPPTTTTDPNALAFGVSFAERYLQFGVYVVFGFVACIGNALMAYGISKSKEMRNRFYVIIVFLLLARVLMSLQLLLLAFYRFLRVIDMVNFSSRIVCALLGLFIYPGTLELFILLVLAVDRAVALFAINYYRKLTWKHAVKTCFLINALILIVKICLIFGDPPLTNTVACFSIFDGVAAQNSVFSQNFDLALLLLLLVVYMVILVALYIRLRQLRLSKNDSALIAINRHMSVMPTVRNIVVVHIVWTLSAKILLTMGIEPFAAAYSARFLLYGGFFVASELMVNVVILLYTNADIRKVTFSFGSKKVEPLVSVSGVGSKKTVSSPRSLAQVER